MRGEQKTLVHAVHHTPKIGLRVYYEIVVMEGVLWTLIIDNVKDS